MLFPYTETRRTLLRPATSADGREDYRIELRLGFNALPTLDEFMSAYAQHFAAHFAIHCHEEDEVLGFSSLFNLDPAGHIEAGLYTDPARAARGIGAEAALLTVNYAFAMWNIRKVFFRATSASTASLGGTMAGMARQEAVFPEHIFFQGQLWDVSYFAVYRQQWEKKAAPLIQRLRAGQS